MTPWRISILAETSFEGVLKFRDALIADATFISLYQDANDVYAATGADRAGLKLRLTELLSTGLPTQFQTTNRKTHERSQFPWVAGALILFDLGFYDSWFFDRIDANDSGFVSHVKSNANPEIVEELQTWRGNSITLEGKSLKAVLDELQRQEIDVLVELEFNRKRDSSATATKQFRLVGLLDEDNGEYHLYFTNLPQSHYPAPDITQLYRTRWEVELLFKELKSRFRLDEINTTKPYVIEALIIMATISLMISRVVIDELHELEAKRRDAADADESASAAPSRRGSLAVECHTHLIQLYLMLALDYKLSDMDKLFLWASRDPNPHRERLRREFKSDEFAFDHH